MGRDKNIGKDLVLDLLNNRKKYTAMINFVKQASHLVHDQDEFEFYMEKEKQLELLKDSIEYLTPVQRLVIQNIYFEEHSIREVARKFHMSKTSVDYQKQQAIKFLRELFVEQP